MPKQRLREFLDEHIDDPDTAWEFVRGITAKNGSTKKVSAMDASEIWLEIMGDDVPPWRFLKTKRRPKSEEEERHLSDVASLGCVVCRIFYRRQMYAEVHHIRETVGMGMRASHMDTVGLCMMHHRTGTAKNEWSIHLRPTDFRINYGSEIELLEQTRKLLKQLPASRYF